MVENGGGYQRVAALSDVPDGGCLAVDAGATSLVLVRRGDDVRALENRCPHAGAPLSEGFLEGCRLTCAWHGWTFDVETGVSTDDETMVVPTFAVRVVGGDVLVEMPDAPRPPSARELYEAAAEGRPDVRQVREVLAMLNAVSLGELAKVDAELARAQAALAVLRQDELAERVGEARRSLAAGDLKEFRRAVSNVTARLGHVR